MNAVVMAIPNSTMYPLEEFILKMSQEGMTTEATGDGTTSSAEGQDPENEGKAKWILPIILLALLGVFLWYWLNHDNGVKEAAADKKDAIEMTSSADSAAAALNAELSAGMNADTAKGKDTSK